MGLRPWGGLLRVLQDWPQTGPQAWAVGVLETGSLPGHGKRFLFLNFTAPFGPTWKWKWKLCFGSFWRRTPLGMVLLYLWRRAEDGVLGPCLWDAGAPLLSLLLLWRLGCCWALLGALRGARPELRAVTSSCPGLCGSTNPYLKFSTSYLSHWDPSPPPPPPSRGCLTTALVVVCLTP